MRRAPSHTVTQSHTHTHSHRCYHAVRVFFLADPALVYEATVKRAGVFRHRTDAGAGVPGIVGAVDEWSAARQRVARLQSRQLIDMTAIPAVTEALESDVLPNIDADLPTDVLRQVHHHTWLIP